MPRTVASSSLWAMAATVALMSSAGALARTHHHRGQPARGAKAAAEAAPAKAPPAPPPPAPAPAQAPAKADEVEEIESVDLATDTGAGKAGAPAGAEAAGATASAPAAPEGLTRTQLIAHLHPALVHLPIAWVVLWAVWELLALRWRDTFLPSLPVLATLAVLAFVPATVTGLLHLQELPEAADVRAPALLHRNLMYASLGLSILVAALRLRWRELAEPPRLAVMGGLAVLWINVALIGYAAHIGGKMVYGDDYLPF